MADVSGLGRVQSLVKSVNEILNFVCLSEWWRQGMVCMRNLNVRRLNDLISCHVRTSSVRFLYENTLTRWMLTIHPKFMIFWHHTSLVRCTNRTKPLTTRLRCAPRMRLGHDASLPDRLFMQIAVYHWCIFHIGSMVLFDLIVGFRFNYFGPLVGT